MNIPHARLLLGLVLLAIVAVLLRAAQLQAVTVRNTGVLAFNRSVVAPDNNHSEVLTAETRLQTAAALNPTHQSTQRLLGYAYLAQGREDAAVTAWQSAGDMGVELVGRGSTIEETGALDDALRWYHLAAAADPQQPESYLRAGAILEQREAWQAAAELYRTGVAAGGPASENSDLYYRLANAVSRLPEPISWSDVLFAAARATSLGNFNSAYNSVQVHYVMGLALLELGRTREAQSAFAQVVGARPDDYWSNVQLGRLAWSLDDNAPLAERYLRAAISHNPAIKAAYRDLAELLFESGQLEDAITTYELLLALDPNDPAVREKLDAIRPGS